jgi:probable rRNA maturation factor
MKSDPLISFRRKPATLDTEGLETFAETLRLRIAKRAEFHCLITGDAELRKLNNQYRGKDEPTDVLSFPSGGGSQAPYLGDIAISLAKARAQAGQFGHALEDELRILMLHGVLHLTGLDHETDAGQMARTEQRWRKKLGLATSLTERAK